MSAINFTQVLKRNPYHDDRGRFTSKGQAVDTTVFQRPKDALHALANGERVNLAREDVARFLERTARRDDDPNLLHVHVEGTPIFDKHNLGIPRDKMPQIPKDMRDDFLQSLKKQGVEVKKESVHPFSVHPSQKEVSARAVGERIQKEQKKHSDFPPLLVSQDNYILDGHHHWGMVAAMAVDVPSLKVPIHRIMVPHQQAFELMHAYDSKHGIKRRPLKAAWELVLKFNPYHGKGGKFTDKLHALQSVFGEYIPAKKVFSRVDVESEAPKIHAAMSAESGEHRHIPTYQLTATHSIVDATGMESYAAGKEGELPVVLRYNKQHYLIDGHNQVAASILAGRKHVQAKIYDGDAFVKSYSTVLKRNPYHDRSGKFTSKDKAAKPGEAVDLAKRHHISATINELIDHTLKSPEVRQEYREALAEASRQFNTGETTKKQHTKPGTGSYTPERLSLHRQIINKLMGEDDSKYLPAAGQKPKMIMLGGRPGSGKSNFNIEKNKDLGVYDPQKFLVIDADDIKTLLPEYHPEYAAAVHQESTEIFDKMVTIARKRGLNVVLDFTMSSDKVAWAKSFQKAGYETEAYYIHRPPEKAAQFAIQRWTQPMTIEKLDGSKQSFRRGRIVPLDVVLSHKDNEKYFDRLTHIVDKWGLFDNSDEHFNPVKVSSGGKKLSFEQVLKCNPEAGITVYRPKKIAIDCSYAYVLKRNPYHDKEGKFTSKDKATTPSGYHGESKVAQAQASATKAAFVVGKSSITNEKKAYVGQQIHHSFTHQFNSGEKAKAALNLVKDSYATFGATVQTLPNWYTKKHLQKAAESATPGTVLIHRENSKINVVAIHSQKPEQGSTVSHMAADLTSAHPSGVLSTTAQEFTTPKVSEASKPVGRVESTPPSEIEQAFKEWEQHYIKASNYNLGFFERNNHHQKAVELAGFLTQNGYTSDQLTKHIEDFQSKKQAEYADLLFAKKKAEAEVDALYDSHQGNMSDLKDHPTLLARTEARDKAYAFGNTHGFLSSYDADRSSDALMSVLRYNALRDLMEGNNPKSSNFSQERYEQLRNSVLKAGFPSYKVSDLENSTDFKKHLEEFPLKTDFPHTPEGLEEATKQLQDVGDKIAYLKQTASSYDYQGLDLLEEVVKGTYVKAGGTIAEADKNYQLASDNGRERAYEELETKKKITDEATALVKDATFNYHQKADDLGPNHPKTLAAKDLLDRAMESGKAKGVEEYYLGTASLNGVQQYKESVEKKIAETKGGLSKAYYTYYLASAMHGGESEEAQKAFQNINEAMAAVKALKSPPTSGEIQELIEKARTSAEKNKASLDRLKALSADVQKTAQNYDAEDASFKFPHPPLYGRENIPYNASVADEFERIHSNRIKQLTFDERHAVTLYTGSAFSRINKAVAKATINDSRLSFDTADDVKNLDSALNNSKLGMNVRLSRSMAGKWLYSALGVDTPEDEAEAQDLIGKIYTENAYSSTSMEYRGVGAMANSTGEAGTVHLIIRAGKEMPGLRVDEISENKGEDEVILPRGATYIIRGVSGFSKGYSGLPELELQVDMIGILQKPLKGVG